MWETSYLNISRIRWNDIFFSHIYDGPMMNLINEPHHKYEKKSIILYIPKIPKKYSYNSILKRQLKKVFTRKLKLEKYMRAYILPCFTSSNLPCSMRWLHMWRVTDSHSLSLSQINRIEVGPRGHPYHASFDAYIYRWTYVKVKTGSDVDDIWICPPRLSHMPYYIYIFCDRVLCGACMYH